MENLIGFIIFLVIVAVSIVSKIKTEMKGPDDEEQSSSPSLDDLPEATRRILFGEREGDIIVAKPRTATPVFESKTGDGEVPTRPQPTAVPARRVQFEQPAAQPAPGRQVQFERPQQPQSQPQQRPVQRPVQQQPLRPQPQPQPRQPAPQRSAPKRQPAPQAPRSPRQPQRDAPYRRHSEQVARRQQAEADQRRRVPDARPTAAAKRPAVGLAALLRSKGGLAQGVLLREILGPPKAFEDY